MDQTGHARPAIITDRLQYNRAIATSWKEQTLLNLIRLRYADSPEFVDVPSIVNGYSLDHTAKTNAGFEEFPRDAISNQIFAGLELSRSIGDHPTVTIAPQTRADFIRNLVTPIPPHMILSLLEGSNPADAIFEVAVDSINRVRNRQTFGGQVMPADPEFEQIVQAIRKAQMLGSVSIRVRPNKSGKTEGDVVFFIQDQDIEPTLATEPAQMRKPLRLDPSPGSCPTWL